MRNETKNKSATGDQASKGKQLHLRLTYEDWKESAKTLTRAELLVFYAVRTQDPFGDRTLEIDCSLLAEDLGIHRTSVSRALVTLSEKKLIELEISKAKVKSSVNNRRLTLLEDPESTSIIEEIEENEMCAPTHTPVQPCTQQCADAQAGAPTHTAEHPRTNQSPESSQDKASETPQTIQTCSNLKDTTDRSASKKSKSKPVTLNERSQQPRGSVIEIFEKYKEQLNKYGVYLLTYQNEMLQLNPKMEPVIQEAGCLPSDKVEPAIKAFIRWIREAKDVKEPYRAFFKAIKEAWEEL